MRHFCTVVVPKKELIRIQFIYSLNNLQNEKDYFTFGVDVDILYGICTEYNYFAGGLS